MTQPKPNRTSPPPAVLYAVKSTPDERGSIPGQLDGCRKMAEQNGWEVVGEYSEEDESAWTGDRGPQLAAAMEHAERTAPSILVVEHSDRLARGDVRQARHLIEVWIWARRAGVELRSVQDDSTFTNLLLTAAMGERNAEDSRRKSLAIKAGRRRRVESGRAPGGSRSYGYRYDTGKLVQAPAEAEVVRRVFAEFAAGRSLAQIVQALKRDGVVTARDGEWAAATVSGILDHPVYIGKVHAGDEVFDGEHEPIVDEATWEKVRQLRSARSKRPRGRAPKGQHLFRKGILRCGECGWALVPRTREGGQEVYVCRGRVEHGPEHCSVVSLEREPIDTAVYEHFQKCGLDIEATRAQVAEARDRKLAEIRALVAEAVRAERAASEAFVRIRNDYKRGDLSAKEWQEEWRDELTEEREAAKAEVERLKAQEGEVEDWGDLRDAEEETLRKLAAIRRAVAGEIRDVEGIEAARAALLRLFEEFVVKDGEIEAHVRKDAIIYVEDAEPSEDGLLRAHPMLRREPLGEAGETFKARFSAVEVAV